MKDLYIENYKTLLKEITEDTKKWKDILCSWIGIIKMAKMLILSKEMYRVNAIPIKIPMSFFKELRQKIIRFAQNHKSPKHPRKSWKKKQKQSCQYHIP